MKFRRKNKFFNEEIGIHNLLIELEDKQLQWFGPVERMVQTIFSLLIPSLLVFSPPPPRIMSLYTC
jgi:hypothetical protein